eukprot:CAMPEP_0172411148 /NCGR_PEP_ID=MMETSP1061-20121228/77245_1 /TAXON_ID=37318 /ORGANISM="Pseudo-nitzschia pungens, Strain cf. pungens" /LENGTH=788 /DNA_ID=CAMNT_0013147355 /DNA_START=631 /DNA_END=2998 /DNA_ORIENTATION=-
MIGKTTTSGSRRRKALSFSALLWSAWLISTCRSFLPSSRTTIIAPINNNKNNNNKKKNNNMHASRTLPLHYLNDETSTGTGTSTVDKLSIPSTTTTESSLSSSLSLSSSSLLRSWFPNDRQILEFREPNTNVTVLLIGSMHYNPASIKLVERTLTRLGDDQKLGSVIIESCDIRWNKTQEILRRKKEEEEERTTNPLWFLGLRRDDEKTQEILRRKKEEEEERTTNPLWFLGLRRDDEIENENKIENNNENSSDDENIETSPPPPPFETNNDQDFLGNEMRAAWEVATRYNRPTVLGDQRINVTVDALKASLKETASDLLWGGPGGWKRSRDEIAENWDKTIPIAALGGSNNNNSNNNRNNNNNSNNNHNNNSNSEPAYLNAVAFFDPRLLLSLPVSLVKYPLSFLVKDPVPVGAFFLCIVALNFYGTGTTIIDPTTTTTTLDWSDPKALWEAVVAGLAQQYNNNNGGGGNNNLDDYDYDSYSYSVLPWTDYVLSMAIAVVETIVFARLQQQQQQPNNNRNNNNNNNSEPAYLNAVAFFDPRLLLSLPVSLVKYPLSFLVKDPVPVGAFFLCIVALNFYGSGTTIIDPTTTTTTLDWSDPKALWEAVVAGLAQQYNNNNGGGGNNNLDSSYYDSYSVLPWTDYVLSVAIAVVETIVFARLLLKPLLADRNEILARSVLDQCRLFAAAAATEPGIGEQGATMMMMMMMSGRWFDRWFAGPQAVVGNGNGNADAEPGIVYVPGSEPETLLARDSSNNNNNNNNNGEKVVVAVLGMAHCNGVMKLLREQKV